MLLPKSSQILIEERQNHLFHPHKISPSRKRWKSIRKFVNSNSYRVLCFGAGTPERSFVQTGSSHIEAFIYLIFIMKYLEYTPLDRISDFLSHVNLGERTIKGCLEAYSCKHTGMDKKLSFSLENEILDYLGKSADNDSSSPVEYLSCRSSRKMLVYLILTLYHMYPDYDFSAVETHQFFTEETWDDFKQIFDVYMFDASKDWAEENEGSTLLDTLYKALDEVVKLAECEIYSYNPDSDADPLLERGAIWAFNFFFYNRKLKRVVSFRFSCISNLVSEGFPMDEICYQEDGEIFDDMDM